MTYLERVASERFVIYEFEDRITITGEEPDDIIVLNNYDELTELRDLLNVVLPDGFPNE